jgi:hypothetical protein
MYNAEAAHQTNRAYVMEDFCWAVCYSFWAFEFFPLSESQLVAPTLPMAAVVG